MKIRLVQKTALSAALCLLFAGTAAAMPVPSAAAAPASSAASSVALTAAIPAPGEAAADERAAALWKQFVDAEGLDHRFDLLALKFGAAASRLPGAAAVSGISGEPELMGKFFAEAARAGITLESAVEQVPQPEALGLMTWGLVRAESADLMALDAASAARTEVVARKLVLGERVRIMKRETAAEAASQSGWALVQCTDGRLGWVLESALTLKKDSAFVSWNRQDAAVVRVPHAELKLEDGSVFHAAPGMTFFLLEKATVLLPDGRKALAAADAMEDGYGWQQREEDLRRSRPADYLKAVALSAEKLAGTQAEDLGGPLPVAALRMHDLLAPMDLDRLSRLSSPLAAGRNGADLKTGDLVFFGKGADPESAGVWLGAGRFAAVDPKSGKVAVMQFSDLKQKALRATLGQLLWAVRLEPQELKNPCLISSRSHAFFQAPPSNLLRCRR